MEYLQKIKDNLCGELEELAMKPEMSAGDLETIHKLTDTIKNIDKIAMLEDGDGYSQAGDWEMEAAAAMSAAQAIAAASGTAWAVTAVTGAMAPPPGCTPA